MNVKNLDLVKIGEIHGYDSAAIYDVIAELQNKGYIIVDDDEKVSNYKTWHILVDCDKDGYKKE